MDNHSEKKAKDLIDFVFSWSLKDVLNNKLYKNQVKEIPQTFTSLVPYADSFLAPLLEETRAELRSSVELLSQATVCEILSAKRCEKNTKLLDYFLTIQQLKPSPYRDPSDIYEPKKWDLFALSIVRPKSISDLIRNDRPYTLALITVGIDEEEKGPVYHVKVRTSQRLAVSEAMEWKKETLYAVLVANLATSFRIWTSLSIVKAKPNDLKIIKLALYNGPSVKQIVLLFLTSFIFTALIHMLEGINGRF